MEDELQSYRYYQRWGKGKEFIIPGAHADVGGCYESEVFKQDHSPSVTPARLSMILWNTTHC
ncbi:hypothetical protein EJ377_04265 [Chryseobacterium arthrosphaerae]|uniref:Uncharacterized protein n=1 Tax=Chryseobacterium arthrosphaerae TaxID=651561 RepID=A0A432DZA1_9FLAO|nr:hypothetical protein EJ377_04265 [Chryseobacterium arthrosphaerae]